MHGDCVWSSSKDTFHLHSHSLEEIDALSQDMRHRVPSVPLPQTLQRNPKLLRRHNHFEILVKGRRGRSGGYVKDGAALAVCDVTYGSLEAPIISAGKDSFSLKTHHFCILIGKQDLFKTAIMRFHLKAIYNKNINVHTCKHHMHSSQVSFISAHGCSAMSAHIGVHGAYYP